jgi:hypothetical protein
MLDKQDVLENEVEAGEDFFE